MPILSTPSLIRLDRDSSKALGDATDAINERPSREHSTGISTLEAYSEISDALGDLGI